MAEIAIEDRNRLRATPAYRRAVWGLRMISLSVLSGILIFLLALLRFPEAVAVPLFAVAFVAMSMGVALGWSSVLPLEKTKRAIRTKYQLDAFDAAALMNGMLIRDVVRLRNRAPSDDFTDK
ncbi:hypothetical protein AB0G04_17420 [Actinoplanes sp. NPDC023801]|uniref:hypothetical protein n=1 Tax=Actinoplanes sp. NPDC023801 TaxID=3154595 RepID=UPI0033C9DF9D